MQIVERKKNKILKKTYDEEEEAVVKLPS